MRYTSFNSYEKSCAPRHSLQDGDANDVRVEYNKMFTRGAK